LIDAPACLVRDYDMLKLSWWRPWGVPLRAFTSTKCSATPPRWSSKIFFHSLRTDQHPPSD